MIHGRALIPLVFALLYLGLNVLIYSALKKWFGQGRYWKFTKTLFWLSLVFVFFGIVQLMLRFQSPTIFPSPLLNWFIGFTFSLMIGEILFGIVLLFDRLIGLPFQIFNFINKSPTEKRETNNGRRKFVQTTSTIVAGLPFLSMIYGITFGKYNYQVRKIVLKFPDLPEAFNGFKIAQISDIHSGSFDDKEAVLKGVKMVNDQLADLIVFTGDLVNSRSKEIVPFLDVFSQLKAKHGVMSTKGNHDYGVYYDWPNRQAQIDDQVEMQNRHSELGFDLLNNENRTIEKNGEKINIVGVENWGLTPFPQVGDLDKALEGTENAPFTILLSHDPSHWDEVVLNHKRHIHLTLSGHTHGMQFGVDIPGLKWSPVQYKYPRWAGLYKEKNQCLYVNRGFGFIGFPGRVGIMPEISVFELQRG